MGISIFNRNSKTIFAKVSTMDADLDKIVMEKTWTGRHLFEAVCRIIGMREVWFFGLQYTNKKQIPCWLQMDKTICNQDVVKSSDGSFHFLFLIKFYPEDVNELILDLTKHLFFLQIKQAILSMDLYCSPEASVLLASFAAQALHGDCEEESEPFDLEKLLPRSVIDQYDMTVEMWRDRIKRWWSRNSGQSREDAELEYLRVAQDLEMYGIFYYPIYNNKESDLHLGISAQGLGIYKGVNRITPRPFFSWSEIKNIQFKRGKFHMKTVDKSTISFRSRESSIDSSILDLCVGTHNLYLRRRQADTLEVQQMKQQAKEDKQRRLIEFAKLDLERKERMNAIKVVNDLKEKCEKLADALSRTKEEMRRTEEINDQLSEKARTSEQEIINWHKKASEAEAECNRLSMNQVKSEEALLLMERKARQAEILAKQMSMSLADVSLDAIRKPHYSSQTAFITDPIDSPTMSTINGHMSSASSYHQLQMVPDGYQRPARPRTPPSHIYHQQQQMIQPAYQPTSSLQSIDQSTKRPMIYQNGNGQLVVSTMALPPPDPSVSHLYAANQGVRSEIEKSRMMISERERHFKEHMEALRRDIEGLKRDSGMVNVGSEYDLYQKMYEQSAANNFDKFTAMRMMKSKSVNTLLPPGPVYVPRARNNRVAPKGNFY